MSDRYVQYGCGFNAPLEWENYDCSPTLRFERIPIIGKLYTRNAKRFPPNIRYGDIVKGLPGVQKESCRGIYCSHVLEHLALDDFRLALQNTQSYLQRGGTFRFVIPDLEVFVRRYIFEIECKRSDASIDFLAKTLLGKEKGNKTLFENVKTYLGNANHLWMWDRYSMKAELSKVGFKDIREANFGDSSDKMFQLVERSDSFIDSFSFECKK